MGWLEGVREKLELAEIQKENAAFRKKFGDDPGHKFAPLLYTGARSNRRVVREEIGSMTGEVTGYVDENDVTLKAGCDYTYRFRDPKTGEMVTREILSPDTREFRALQELKAPPEIPEQPWEKLLKERYPEADAIVPGVTHVATSTGW